MGDLDHQWGADLSLGPTGDIALVKDSTLGQQRVLRRLLTNLLDYIWQPDYGAGLASFVGTTSGASQIQSVVRGQIFRERSVAQTPSPVVTVVVDPGGPNNHIYAEIQYVDIDTAATQILAFSVSN